MVIGYLPVISLIVGSGLEIGAQQLGDADFLLKNATNTNVLAQTDFKTKALDAKLVY